MKLFKSYVNVHNALLEDLRYVFKQLQYLIILNKKLFDINTHFFHQCSGIKTLTDASF